MIHKKIISLILSLTLVSTISGCSAIQGIMNPSDEKIKKADNTKYEITIPKEEVSTNVENMEIREPSKTITVKNNTSIEKRPTVDMDDIISLKGVDSNQVLTYRELAELLSAKLYYEINDYRMNEHVEYNYSNISELNLVGVYIDETVDTVRKADQYYRDSKRVLGKTSFNRNVEAIKYKDKANKEVQKGTFYTREKKKPVKLEWEPIEYEEDSKDIQRFIDTKYLDFGDIVNFYYYNNDSDFSVECTGNLKDFLSWNTIDNTGIRTLKDNKVVITREIVKEGVTIETPTEIEPLKANITYDLTVKKDEEGNTVIELSTDLTKALEVYYAIYDQYDIINANYSLKIICYKNASIATSSQVIKE